MKFKSVHKQYHGQSINLPIIGLTKLDADGIIDVPQHAVSQFDTSPDWITVDDVEDEEPNEEILSDDEKDIFESLDKLTLKEMLDLASATFPAEAYNKFKNNKKLMLNFLKHNVEMLVEKPESEKPESKEAE